MLLRAQGEGVHVDTSVRVAGVVLVGLHQVEVGALTLGEAVLTVELELGGHNRVLTPAVEVQGGLGQHEGASVRHGRGRVTGGGSRSARGSWGSAINEGLLTTGNRVVPVGRGSHVSGTGIVEEARHTDVVRGGGANGLRASEGVERVGQSINGVGVVEGLGTKDLVQQGVALEGTAVVDVLVGLHNPDQLLDGVVQVEADLVGRGTNRLVTSELELLDQVLVGVLGHPAALISVQEHVVDVQGGGNQGLVVGGHGLGGTAGAVQVVHGPQALINGADVKVDLDLVVLKSDQRQGETGVTAVPELEWHVEGGLRESVAGSAHLARGAAVARAVHVGEAGVNQVGKLGSVTDHLVVPALLLRGKGKLVPDVHPVTVLAIDALATNLNLDLSDHLLAGEVQPAGVHTLTGCGHALVDLGQSHLEVGAVCQVTVAADSAGHTATEIGLAVECLLDGLHREVSVATVGHLPESDLGITGQVHVLCTVGYKLHKSTSHGYSIAKENNLRKSLRRECKVVLYKPLQEGVLKDFALTFMFLDKYVLVPFLVNSPSFVHGIIKEYHLVYHLVVETFESSAPLDYYILVGFHYSDVEKMVCI